MQVVAVSCLFLGGKVEETPKKCKDFIPVAKKAIPEHQFVQFGEDPKEEILAVERVLLKTIRFDLAVEHPYTYLLSYAKILKGDKQKIQHLVQMAWTFVNDSLCTNLCLQWEPEIIAIALMYLASRLSRFEISDWEGKKNVRGERWWDCFVQDLQVELLEEICHTVLDLYSTSQGKEKKAKKSAGAASSTSSNTPMTTPSTSNADQSKAGCTPDSRPSGGGPMPATSGMSGGRNHSFNVPSSTASSGSGSTAEASVASARTLRSHGKRPSPTTAGPRPPHAYGVPASISTVLPDGLPGPPRVPLPAGSGPPSYAVQVPVPPGGPMGGGPPRVPHPSAAIPQPTHYQPQAQQSSDPLSNLPPVPNYKDLPVVQGPVPPRFHNRANPYQQRHQNRR